MKTLDKLSLITKVLKEMGCEPDKISVSDAPDNKLLISLQYKGAGKINRNEFNRLVNDKNAELHIPSVVATDKGKQKCNNIINIFY